MTERGTKSYPIPISAGGEFTVYRGGSSLLTKKRRLCSVVERLADGDPDDRGVFHGMPWFTPILGSGCLELGDGPSVDIEAIDQIARDAMVELSDRHELGPIGPLARAFAEALRGSRTHDNGRGTGYPPVQPTRAAVRLIVLTALLTRLFHGAAMSVPSPTSRWWVKERVELAGSSDTTDVYLRDIVLPAILELLDNTPIPSSGDEEDSNADMALHALRNKIAKELRGSPPAVCIEDLQMITELTWLELIRETSIYPGWSDLLLQLLMTYSESDAPVGHRPKVVELAHLGQEVANLLHPATERSWSSRSDPRWPTRPTERDKFYSAVARLLHAEADLFRLIHVPDPVDFDEGALDPDAQEQLILRANRAEAIRERIELDTRTKRGEGSRIRVPSVMVPHAVVFVTSFDVEMEMALWAAGRPYRVVVPVLATTGRRDDADLVWLAATVHPSANDSTTDLGILSSGPHDWQIAQQIFRPGEGGEHPTVVRLSGSPLMTLPEVSGALHDAFVGIGFEKEVRITLFHALIIDEYTSLRQSENELFFVGSKKSRGLPGCLSGGTNSNDRLWVGLGVQIDDPAIRSRVFSQLSAGSMIDRTDRHEQGRGAGPDIEDIANGGAKHDVRGLAVNQRIDEAEATALHWLGFQFAIQVSSGSLTRDIEHCAEHVNEVVKQAGALRPDSDDQSDPRDANWRRATNGSCDLWKPAKATR